MINYFTANFRPGAPDSPEASLAISGGRGGARLTHSHDRQYHFVLQTLTLWSEISTDMFKLWCLAGACVCGGVGGGVWVWVWVWGGWIKWGKEGGGLGALAKRRGGLKGVA